MLRVARRSLNYAANKESFIPKEGKYPLGFTVNAVASGVKKDKELDLSLITSPKFPMTTAGVFTTNKFAAAPVLISKNQIQLPNHQVLINSGCANACTGKEGYDNALQIIQAVDSIFAPGTIVMSTGVIGQHLQVPKLKSGIAELEKTLGNTHHDWMRVAEGIMTTDTFPKLISTEFTGPSGTFRMVGIAKGAGMIHPNMATMLAGIFTDAVVSKPNLDAVTRSVVESSFNAISVDGDTSTNDTFIVCANGASGTEVPIVEFQARLEKFAIDLAKLIVYDGEGATKFVDVRVEDAKEVCGAICKSPLVKTALYGKDANWGRIVCAVGYSGVPVIPEKVTLTLSDATNSLVLFKDGMPTEPNEELASKILENRDIAIKVELALGKYSANMYTCDMSHEYISINADYRN